MSNFLKELFILLFTFYDSSDSSFFICHNLSEIVIVKITNDLFTAKYMDIS